MNEKRHGRDEVRYEEYEGDEMKLVRDERQHEMNGELPGVDAEGLGRDGEELGRDGQGLGKDETNKENGAGLGRAVDGTVKHEDRNEDKDELGMDEKGLGEDEHGKGENEKDEERPGDGERPGMDEEGHVMNEEQLEMCVRGLEKNGEEPKRDGMQLQWKG